jgi:signal transduction histidine kinase
VRDSGPPIPIDQREEIFAAYVTSTGTSAPEVSSIGLGLKVSRRLAELLGGGLTYHHDGTWSVFRLELGAAADGTAPSDAIDRATAAMPR